MNGKSITLAVFGVALMLLPIPDVDEVEWFPQDINPVIAKSTEVNYSENAAQTPRDASSKFKTNDQLDR